MYGYDKSISNIKGRAIDIIHTVSGGDLYFEHLFLSKVIFENYRFRVRMTLLIQYKEAHNAGITCMSLMVDAERNVFVLTGSYDKVVKEYI